MAEIEPDMITWCIVAGAMAFLLVSFQSVPVELRDLALAYAACILKLNLWSTHTPRDLRQSIGGLSVLYKRITVSSFLAALEPAELCISSGLAGTYLILMQVAPDSRRPSRSRRHLVAKKVVLEPCAITSSSIYVVVIWVLDAWYLEIAAASITNRIGERGIPCRCPYSKGTGDSFLASNSM